MIKIKVKPTDEKKRGFYLGFLCICGFGYQYFVPISDSDDKDEYALSEKEAKAIYKLCKSLNKRSDGGKWFTTKKDMEDLLLWHREKSPKRDKMYGHGLWYYNRLKDTDLCTDKEINMLIDIYDKIRHSEFTYKIWKMNQPIYVDCCPEFYDFII